MLPATGHVLERTQRPGRREAAHLRERRDADAQLDRVTGVTPGLLLGPQLVVPAGVWQAAVPTSGPYALAGCTVAPGFEFSEFELANTARLAASHPLHAALIARLGHA